MNNTQVHIITGYSDTGKTTTAWLIYLSLKQKGTVEYFRVFRNHIYDILPESETPMDTIETYTDSYGVTRAWDFCAIIIVGQTKVTIFSAGDNAFAINKAFGWIAGEKPSVFVGCCRNHGKSSARKALRGYESQYNMTFYRVHYDYKDFDMIKAQECRKELAEEIVNSINKQ